MQNLKELKGREISCMHAKMKRTRRNMKIRPMNTEEQLKRPETRGFQLQYNCSTFFGLFNETTLSWELKHLFSTTYNVKYYRKREPL